MKKLALLTLACLLSVSLWAQSNQTRNHSGFSGISILAPATLYISQGDYSVKLEGEDLDEIETKTKGNHLVIKREGSDKWFNWNWGDDERVKIYISLPKLEKLHISGSGTVIGQSQFNTNDLEVHISGSGSVKLAVNADNIDARISGSGSLDLNGSANVLDAHISGSGKIKAQEVRSRYADVHISGSGNCYVDAQEAIKASISGSGSVYYKGSPGSVDVKSSGSGRVKKI
jgi:hypothetical protein